MTTEKRLYPTVKEKRSWEELERRLRLHESLAASTDSAARARSKRKGHLPEEQGK